MGRRLNISRLSLFESSPLSFGKILLLLHWRVEFNDFVELRRSREINEILAIHIGLKLLQRREQMERRLAVILNVLISCKALCSISILFMLPSAACYCIRTYYARPFEQTISHKGYSNDQHCSFTIEPSARYNGNNNGTSHFFLEITWKHFFDVKGTMPHCENDYVEVFLTRFVVISSC